MKGNLLEVRSFEKARISQKSKGLCAQAVTLTVTVPGNCNYCVHVYCQTFFFSKKNFECCSTTTHFNIKRVHIPVHYSCSYSTSDGRIAPICYCTKWCSQIRRPAPQQQGGGLQLQLWAHSLTSFQLIPPTTSVQYPDSNRIKQDFII
jgi:hypothetical protein